ncbi:Peptide methionine sulfoxide reductase MsrA 2 [Aquisphaera giovannonii]|uniref:Peptide methionine sulfoxide reductase MsrA n=1 Tax=Aquisphaera giovannonii TaxID=406548 RepID=A0A5B9VVP9_9BACT|nr:peptide-methionine (S)-S-oxide reductase MsrA [Aquisphaera giovannonii]QEH32154.1 Peptide methionine sulfoxide reductase MsrA 2 [Aquisphaera giovannonii]
MTRRLLVPSLVLVSGLLGMTQDDGSAKKQGDKPSADAAKASPNRPAAARRKKPELATFGGGCFWCTEAVFERIPGVRSVVSGYSGGSVPNPTYQQVSSGLTGHAEVIQVEYDPEVLPFGKLLHYFWTAHDPTTLNSQGPDFGTQYRSIILYHDEAQKEEALKQLEEFNARRARRSPAVTQIVPFEAFYPAEPYHQDYYRNHPEADYSQAIIEPKVYKIRQKLKQEAAAEARSERAKGGSKEKEAAKGKAKAGSQ